MWYSMCTMYSYDNTNNNINIISNNINIISNYINIISNYIDITKDLHYFDVYEIRIRYHFIDCINGSCTKQVVFT